jgi:hypothetical protein
MAKEKENWNYWQMPTSTNPYIDLSEIEEAKDNMPEFAFKQEYLAEFAENEMNPFGHGYIDMCLQTKLSNKATKYYGIDIAFKNDWTVIIGLDEDGQMSYYERFQDQLPQTQERIKNLIGDTSALMDSTGMGQGMYQQLRGECMGLEGLTYTGGKGDNSKYRLINGLIMAVQRNEIGILESEVSNEMYNFTYLYKNNGDITYEAPSGLHDDCVNALALAVKCREFAPVYAPIVFGDQIINP